MLRYRRLTARATRTDRDPLAALPAKRLAFPSPDATFDLVRAGSLQCGDAALVEVGDRVPANGRVLAIADEDTRVTSADAVRPTTLRSCDAVTRGLRIERGWIVIEVTRDP